MRCILFLNFLDFLLFGIFVFGFGLRRFVYGRWQSREILSGVMLLGEAGSGTKTIKGERKMTFFERLKCHYLNPEPSISE